MAETFPDFAPTDRMITSDRIRRLVAYWQAKCDGRPIPLRADIDPSEIRDLLPNLLLAEIEEPFRVRYRLVGTRVVEFNRIDFTGTYLDDNRWDAASRYSRAYRAVAETRLPHYGLDAWPLAGAMNGRSEIVMLPLSTDGVRVDRCLAMEDFLFSAHDLPRDKAR
ncbi:PAS domain-containing protein [Dongia sp.]|uniref:PAS domain-containing protein n=1 Tax=Dongia sp. TaxID=1977262 RepID=UPI0035B0C4EE